MVLSLSKPTSVEDLSEPSKLKNSVDRPDYSDPKTSDASLADSFFDFESINEWFQDNPTKTNPDSIDIIEFGALEMAEECDAVPVENPERVDADYGAIGVVAMAEDESGGWFLAEDPVVTTELELIVDGSVDELKVEAEESEKLGKLSLSIAKDLGKVSLTGETESCGLVDGNDSKTKVVGDDEDDSVSVSRPETTGSSSSSASSSESSSESESTSSSSDEDESDSDDDNGEAVHKKMEGNKKENVETEIEEGEIMEADGRLMVSRDDDEEDDDDHDDVDVDNMVTWSDVDEEDDGGAAAKPIRSKNELADLPPVPPVDVVLQPSHQMLPVGVVLSIIGAKVIVEGLEKHNPLSEGSILWIAEKRSPLGLIDEIFGPVKNPYYVVRYNSESEVPAELQDGSLISFVPEFVDHVLNDKNLYQKGYDASGDNDEEVSDEAEFSDDEKEAEYKRLQKMSKRGSNDQNLGNGKNSRKKGKNKNRDEQWKNTKPSGQQPNMGASQLPPDQNQHHIPPAASAHDHGNSSSFRQVPTGGTGTNPSFPQNMQAGGFAPIPNGTWNNGMQYQQPQGNSFANGFPAESMPWLLQNLLQNPYQMPMQNRMPFQQQFDSTQRPTGGQPFFFPGSACAPWTGFVGQNGFNQTPFGMGFQGQQLPPPTNAGQVMMPNGVQMGQNHNFRPPVIPGSDEAPQQFNQGASSGRGRGRKPYHRGVGRFAGGRGRHQSK